jgi:hypothetical protein
MHEYVQQRMRQGLTDMTNTMFGFKDEGNDGKNPNETGTPNPDPTLNTAVEVATEQLQAAAMEGFRKQLEAMYFKSGRWTEATELENMSLSIGDIFERASGGYGYGGSKGMPRGQGFNIDEITSVYNELVQKQAAATGDEAQAWKGAIDILTTYRDIMYEQQDLVQERKDMMGDDSWKAAQAIDAKSVEGMNAMLGYRDNDSKTFKEIASKVKDLDRKFQSYQEKFSQFMADQNHYWQLDISATNATAKALK